MNQIPMQFKQHISTQCTDRCRCDNCGMFISAEQLSTGKAKRELVTPSSLLSEETWKTFHLECPVIPRKSIPDRFLNMVDKTDGCWNWTGHTNKKGYGLFHYKDSANLSHRVSYNLFVGEIPKDKMVLHHCDNPTCVNPEHLYVGTALDNSNDMVNRGRANYVRGEESGMSKLTDGDVYVIRDLVSIGTKTKAIAQLMEVDVSTINRAATGRAWKHL